MFPALPAPHGIWLPLITPFRDDTLDEVSLRRLVRHYAARPIDGLILAATTGEGLTLDAAETECLVTIAASELATTRRMPIALGLCGSHTAKLIRSLYRNRVLADRRVSDRLPLLHASPAIGPARALHRTR